MKVSNRISFANRRRNIDQIKKDCNYFLLGKDTDNFEDRKDLSLKNQSLKILERIAFYFLYLTCQYLPED